MPSLQYGSSKKKPKTPLVREDFKYFIAKTWNKLNNKNFEFSRENKFLKRKVPRIIYIKRRNKVSVPSN